MKAKQQGFKSDVLGVGSVNLTKLVGSAVLEPKEFSTGKVGYFAQGAYSIKCGEGSYKFQLGINFTCIENAKQILDQVDKDAILNSQPMTADTLLKGKVAVAKIFSTGSCGFHHSDKIQLEVNGRVLAFQLGVLLTAHGSKEWDEQRPVEQAKKGEQPTA